jgi:hypothetical protein
LIQVPTWLDHTAATIQKSKADQKRQTVVETVVPKTPTSVKKQMSIMAFVKKKKDKALATRIMSGLSASPGLTFYNCKGNLKNGSFMFLLIT